MSMISPESIRARNAIEELLLAWGFDVIEEIELGEIEFSIAEGSPEPDILLSNKQLMALLEICEEHKLQVTWVFLTVKVPATAEAQEAWDQALIRTDRTAVLLGEDPLVAGVDGEFTTAQLMELLLGLVSQPNIRFDPGLHIPMVQ